MFLAKTLFAVPIYKAFEAVRAAQIWAEIEACREHEAQRCESTAQSPVFRHKRWRPSRSERPSNA
jgi:hypothetical protein